MFEDGPFIFLNTLNPPTSNDPAAMVRFGREGGVIGRASHCDWVLDDPERFLSKEHARVTCENGGFYITALGRNGLIVNGSLVAGTDGGRRPLKQGDRLKLGRYDIVVNKLSPSTREVVSLPPAPPVDTAGPSQYPPVSGSLSAAPPAGPPAPPTANGEVSESAKGPANSSDDWDARLGDLLRSVTTGGATAAGAPQVASVTPLRDFDPALEKRDRTANEAPKLGPLMDLPPPMVVLPQGGQATNSLGPAAGKDPASDPMSLDDTGPLSSLLLGRAVPEELPRPVNPLPSIPPEQPAPAFRPAGIDQTLRMTTVDLPAASPLMEEAPRPIPGPAVNPPPDLRLSDWMHPSIPPDAAFLRGAGIGLPQIGADQAAVIAYDLGRALAALADMLVEASREQGQPPTGVFAALPTGPLALSELVASPNYVPGQLEHAVRDAIAQIRRLRTGSRGGALTPLDVTALEPARLMAQWKLDPRRRDSAARAWGLYEANFAQIIEQAREGSRDPAPEQLQQRIGLFRGLTS